MTLRQLLLALVCLGLAAAQAHADDPFGLPVPRISGKKFAHVFLQSTDPRLVTWHALHPGDAAIVKPASDGDILELEDWEFSE